MINGLVAGRYRIERLIGEGGMSRVYQALDQRLNRSVALKVLREQFASDHELAERFAREAQTAASLSHPNIISIFDVVQEGDVAAIVMELVDGRPLREYIDADAPFELHDVVTVLDQLCDALDYAHSHGVVHRDLKPENVIVTPQGRVKIGDFGIARSVNTATLTAEGTVLGSAYYLSPEQAQGQAASNRSDIYSAGVMAYEMLTGLRPFSGDTALSVAMQHVEAEPAAPSRLTAGVPPAVDGVLLKALAKFPYQRYATAMELADALAAVGQQPAAPPLPNRSAAPAMAVPLAGKDPLVATIAMPPVAPGGRAMAVPMPAGPAPFRTGAARQGRGGAWTGLIVGALGLLFVLLAFMAGAQVLHNLPSIPSFAPPSAPARLTSPSGGPSSNPAAAARTSTPTATPRVSATSAASGTPTETETVTGSPTVTETASVSATPTVTLTVPATPTAPPTWTPTPRVVNTPVPTATPAPPPGSVLVPSVVGLTEEQAQQAIKNAGLTTTYPNYQTFTSQPAGHVLSQQPPAGTAVPKGTTVYIAVRR